MGSSGQCSGFRSLQKPKGMGERRFSVEDYIAGLMSVHTQVGSINALTLAAYGQLRSPSAPGPDAVRVFYGSWGKAKAALVDFLDSEKLTDKELYLGPRLISNGHNKIFSSSEIKKHMKRVLDEYGPITSREYSALCEPKDPSGSTVIQYLGKWNTMLIDMGYEPVRPVLAPIHDVVMDEIVVMIRDGLTILEISSIVDATRNQIYAGLNRRGTSVTDIRQRLPGGPKPSFTDSQRDVAFGMIRKGVPVLDIAAHFGVSRDLIYALTYRNHTSVKQLRADV